MDQIHGGVRDRHEIALNMNEELATQEIMMNEIDKKVDILQEKFKLTNQRMKTLLAESVGASRWCSLIIGALVGYIFNLV